MTEFAKSDEILKGEIVGVKMEAIGGLMLKVLPKGSKISKWLCVEDNPEILKCESSDTMKRAINFWLKR